MTTKNAELPVATLLFRLLNLLIETEALSKVAMLWRLGRKLIKPGTGMYEVLEHEATLELRDPHGCMALVRKYQKVRFKQDNIIAFQDQAWGDGNIFADYKCSPGWAVDRYQEGYRYRILISLREAKKRGDIEEFWIERTVTEGFTKQVEVFQTEVDHDTQKLSIKIIFPLERTPKSVGLITKSSQRTMMLGPKHLSYLPDGRCQAAWSTSNPRLFEAYTLRWLW